MTKEENNKEKKTTKRRNIKKKVEKVEKVILEEKKENNEVKKENNSKIKYTLRDILLIMVLAIIFGFLLGRIIAKNNTKKSIRELNDVDKVYDKVANNYYGELDNKSINSSLIEGLLNGLNDKYAFYYNDKMGLLNYNEEINGYFIGLGVQIRANEDGTIEVLDVYKDSPAQKAGLLVGDIIIKMDDEEYNSNNFYDLIYNIKSSKIGDKVKIGIMRNGEEKEVKVELEKVDVESVSYTVKEANGKNIGIITINNFANNTYEQFLSAFKELEKENIKGLILDVRNNYEGKLENASKIAELFLGKGSVIYIDGKKEIKSSNERKITIPTVVVIDGTTVSSAELLASSLNENLNVPLVGTRTYGKGLMQEVIKLSNGRYVQYTNSEWKTSKGLVVEGNGITPTHNVENQENEIDEPLEKALEVISSQMGQV